MTGLEFFIGAGILVMNAREETLLMQRQNASSKKFEKFNGVWANPGGRMEPGQEIYRGACREVFEELGIIVQTERFLSVFEDIDREAGIHGVYIGYEGYIKEGNVCIKEPEKCSRFGWFALNDLPRPLANFTQSYVAAYNRLRGL
ncbi:MAG: NUDIX domain-containing protein [Nanoarchaeota archaeon]|nr:NUDIX domain-containing protein [Nanoarchaeota archaeon]